MGWVIPLEALPLPAAILTAGEVSESNALAERLLGWRAGTPLASLLHPSERAAISSVLADAGRAPIEIHSPDGRSVWSIAIQPVDDEHHLAIATDVSEVNRRGSIIDGAADATLVVDARGKIVWSSDSLRPRVDELRGAHAIERIHPEDLPLTLELFSRILQADAPPRITFRVRARSAATNEWDRMQVWLANRLTDPLVRGVIAQVDNLDRGDLIDEVGGADEAFASLAEIAPVGIVATDALGHVVFRNRLAAELLGDADDWLERVTPSSRPDAEAIARAAIVEARPGKATVSVRSPDGRRGWMIVRVSPQLASSGRVLGMIVALEDVTAEFDTRARVAWLADLLDAGRDFVAAFDLAGRVLDANAAARERFGLRAGGDVRLIESVVLPASLTRFDQEARRSLEAGKPWQGELDMRGTDGSVVAVSVVCTPRFDDGRVVGWSAIGRDVSDLRADQERLRVLADHDSLTALPNRRTLLERLDHALMGHRHGDGPIAVLFCDLDDFKEINDRLGHGAGDQVLVEVSRRLRATLRGGDTAARLGGDEFVIVADGRGDVAGLAQLARRLIAAVAEPITIDGEVLRVGMSIGIAEAAPGTRSAHQLLAEADQALLAAKGAGKNCWATSGSSD